MFGRLITTKAPSAATPEPFVIAKQKGDESWRTKEVNFQVNPTKQDDCHFRLTSSGGGVQSP